MRLHVTREQLAQLQALALTGRKVDPPPVTAGMQHADLGRSLRRLVAGVEPGATLPELRAAVELGVWGAEDRLDDALWRQAVESHRWLRRDDRRGYGDAGWWHVWRGVLALRWAVSQRCGPPPGFTASRELAVRPPGRVAQPDGNRLL